MWTAHRFSHRGSGRLKFGNPPLSPFTRWPTRWAQCGSEWQFITVILCKVQHWKAENKEPLISFLIKLLKILFIFREGKGGRKRGRKTSMCGCLPLTSYWGPGLQPRHVPQTNNWTGDPLVRRLVLNPLSHTSQGWRLYFLHALFWGFVYNIHFLHIFTYCENWK